MEVDEKLKSLGKCGCYQTIIFVCLSIVYLRGAWQTFAPVFLAADPGHVCKANPNDLLNNNLTVPVSYSISNITLYNQSDLMKDIFKAEACSVTYSSTNNENVSLSCEHGWDYGSQFESTIVTEWDLVCNDDYKIELSTTVYMIGCACGSIALSYFSDKFGRKKVLIICLLLQAIVGVGAAFSTSYLIFTVLRFFIGLLNMGIGLTSFVMMTELFPAAVRTYPSLAIQIFWASGIMLFALYGYLIRKWCFLQILITAPNFLLVIYLFFLPESIPWLMANQYYEDADDVISWALKLNKITLKHPKRLNGHHFIGSDDVLPTPDNRYDDNEEDSETESVIESIGLLFRLKNIRLYTLIIIYLFTSNSLVYFGISFTMPILHGDIFLNLFLSGLVELPAYIISMVIITRIGRRIPLMVYMALCGVATICGALVPETTASGSSLTWLKILFFMISKFAITGSYSTVYLFAAEIFPTVVRNLAMGIASFFENLGAIGAPFIMYAAKKIPIFPVVAFSGLSILGCFLIVLLPETNKKPLPQTVTETYRVSIPTVHENGNNRNSHMITEL